MTLAVETKELTRVFKQRPPLLSRRKEKAEVKDVVALDHVSVGIKEGELFGLLGPNGAGKTTLIKILATLLLPSSGTALVAGNDVTKDPFPIRTRINMVSGGETSGYGLLTVKENVWMFSQFYGIQSKVANQRIESLMKTFGIWDKRNEKVRNISTGQRQKMNMVRGFVTDPSILFLDEPTLGLDVNAAKVIRDFVMEWVREQEHKTVLLTTHYMMEADEMCDRIAIINNGKIMACDTPENLKRRLGRDATVRLEVDTLKETDKFLAIDGVRNFSASNDIGKGLTKLTFILHDEAAVSDVMGEIKSQGSKVHSMHKSDPTLEDVFVAICGRTLE
jgi:ABC-2 type transport system ATP-binding protein